MSKSQGNALGMPSQIVLVELLSDEGVCSTFTAVNYQGLIDNQYGWS